MPLAIVAAALAAVVLWGASPVAAKIAVQSVPPVAVALLRTVLGGLVALPLALSLRIPLPAGPGQRRLLLVSGFCGFVGFPVLFTLGVGLTSANHASMILACLPVFTGAIAMSWDRVPPRRAWWLGCIVALGGEVLLVSGYGGGTGEAHIGGDILVLASNLFASLGYVAGGRLQREGYPSAGTTFWGVVLFALLLLPVTPLVLHDVALTQIAVRAWLAVLYLAVGVTIVGYMLWYWALGRGGIERIGLFQFLQPVSGVVLAWLLLGEHLTLLFLAASIMILSGVWLAVRAK